MFEWIRYKATRRIVAASMLAALPVRVCAIELPSLEDPFVTNPKIAAYGQHLKPATCPPPPDASKPLSLNEVVVATLCHNPNSRGAYLSLLASKDSYDSSFFTPYFSDITVSSELSGSRSRTDGVITRTPVDNSGIGISTSITLYDFGRRERTLARSDRTLIGAGLSYDSTLQGFIVTSLSHYFALLTSQNALNIANESLLLAKDTLDVAETRYKLGIIALPDVLEARTNYANEELSLQNATYKLETDRAALALLIGLPPLTEVRVSDIDDASIMTPPFKQSLLELIEKAKAQRIDLKQARMSLQDAEDNLKDTQYRNLPTISATTSRNYSDWDISNRSNKPTDSATISMSIPIFTGVTEIFNERAERKNLEKTKLSLTQTERETETDVLSAWQSYHAARKSYDITHTTLGNARLRKDIQLQRYKVGLISMLELTTANIAYRNALQADVSARNTLLNTRVALVKAVGELDLRALEPLTQTTPDFAPVVEYKAPIAQPTISQVTPEPPHEKIP